jgi:hypothetical protein
MATGYKPGTVKSLELDPPPMVTDNCRVLSIVLLVAIHHQQVPMPCRIVSESATDLRVCLKPGWEVDFSKEMILAVEEEGLALDSHWN